MKKLQMIIRTIYWHIIFWSFLLLTIVYSLYVIVLFVPPLRRFQPAALAFVGHWWGRVSLWATGSKLTVVGKENIPLDHSYCVIANHQSSFDIPVMMSIFPWTLGFVAKKELRYFPLIGYWMAMMGCVFLDRNDRRQAKVSLEKGARRIKRGQPMVIFPEGTRNFGKEVARFKPGSLKMPIASQTKIIPVTIDGTYRIYEKNKGLITPAQVVYTIHPPITLVGVTADMTGELSERLHRIISGPLT